MMGAAALMQCLPVASHVLGRRFGRLGEDGTPRPATVRDPPLVDAVEVPLALGISLPPVAARKWKAHRLTTIKNEPDHRRAVLAVVADHRLHLRPTNFSLAQATNDREVVCQVNAKDPHRQPHPEIEATADQAEQGNPGQTPQPISGSEDEPDSTYHELGVPDPGAGYTNLDVGLSPALLYGQDSHIP